jgi:hypothetical protein
VETGYTPPLSAPLADTPNKAEVSIAPSASFLFEWFVFGKPRTSRAKAVSYRRECFLPVHLPARTLKSGEFGSRFSPRNVGEANPNFRSESEIQITFGD